MNGSCGQPSWQHGYLSLLYISDGHSPLSSLPLLTDTHRYKQTPLLARHVQDVNGVVMVSFLLVAMKPLLGVAGLPGFVTSMHAYIAGHRMPLQCQFGFKVHYKHY